MKIKEITHFLEQIAPLSYQEGYDNAGLIVGSPETEVNSLLICLDSTEAVIDEAIERGCELIIAHHPIVFNGLKRFNGSNYVERAVIKAIQNNIAIYAIHTNLDNVHNGVNAIISEKLNMTNCRVLAPRSGVLKKLYTFCPEEKAAVVRSALFQAGCGDIGDYSECSFNTNGQGTFTGGEGADPYVGTPGKQHLENEVRIESIFPAHMEGAVINALISAHPYEEVAYDIITLDNKHKWVGPGMIGELEEPIEGLDFLKHLKEVTGTGIVRHTEIPRRRVVKVAVCGGSGSFLLSQAIRCGADAFVTSDLKYHQFFDAEGEIVIADVGHYEGEQFTKELVYGLLHEKFPTFALHLSEVNTNPINYL